MTTSAALIFAALAACPAADAEAQHLITKPYPVSDLTDGNVETFKALADQVVLATGGDAWEPSGGRGTINLSETTHAMVVRQTQSIHEEIVRFLTDERAARRVITIKALVVELPGVRDGKTLREALSLPDAEAGPIVLEDEAAVQRLLGAAAMQSGTKILSRPQLALLNGQEGTFQMGYPTTGNSTLPGVTPEPNGDGLTIRCRGWVGVRESATKMDVVAFWGPHDQAPALSGPGVQVPVGSTLALLQTPADRDAFLIFLTPQADDPSAAFR